MVALEEQVPEMAKLAFSTAYEEAILSGRPVLGTEKIRGVTYVMEKRIIKVASCEPEDVEENDIASGNQPFQD